MISFLITLLLILPLNAFASVGSGLDAVLAQTRQNCTGFSDELKGLKTMVGINTAVSGAGTVAGAGAVVAGVQKKHTDAEIREIVYKAFENKTSISEEVSKLEQRSKSLGNVRTGMMAGSAVANTASAIISATSNVKSDIEMRVSECVKSVNDLYSTYMQVRQDNIIGSDEQQQVEKIVSECGKWKTVDFSKINNKSKGTSILSAVGAGTSIAGTVTSASANSDAVRADDSEAGQKKEENLNNTANVLAGVSTGVSMGATILSATKIKAIKYVLEIADKCEGALQ